ncbi:HTH_Tnp_Tc3_2 domain-containing protein [Trichonephila clavipes]|nr:HTH_Tnp_Tc3_2 domain-containing protein [Trichonephila clavipes]
MERPCETSFIVRPFAAIPLVGYSDLQPIAYQEMPMRIRAHYEKLSEFERSRIIGLKEAGWANRKITHHMGRSNAAIRRCWQEWDSGRFQRYSGRPRAAEDQEDRLIVKPAVKALDSSLSTIRRTTRT